jgi:hypothetical protein
MPNDFEITHNNPLRLPVADDQPTSRRAVLLCLQPGCAGHQSPLLKVGFGRFLRCDACGAETAVAPTPVEGIGC